MIDPIRPAISRSWLIALILALFCLAVSGCIPSLTGSRASVSPAPGGNVSQDFTSEDFVVHRLGRNETPELLAEQYYGNRLDAWRIQPADPKAGFTPGSYVAVPLKEPVPGGLHATGYQTVPILCYHRFNDSCTSSLCIPADLFDRQMAYLKENGYTTISLDMLQEFVEFKRTLPPRSILITIDDGYRSAYDIAYPILKKYGFTATLFIYTDFVGASRNAVTWDHLRELKAQGFDIASHTMSHMDLIKRYKAEDRETYLERIRKELVGSKAILDRELSQETRFIAWPFGRYNTWVLDLSEDVGYDLGFSVERGGNPFFHDPMALRRDQILSRDLKKFASRLKTFNTAELR